LRASALARLAWTALLASAALPAGAAGELNILNWSDYIGPDVISDFSRSEGVKVTYATLDSDDTLQAKLLSGHSGYDVVYPSSTYLAKQIHAGLYQEIDWSKVPNRANLDPALMKKLAVQDPGNRFGVPYVWGTDGIVVNTTRARAALGSEARLDTWDLILKPELAAKLHKCGISLFDSPSDVFPIVLAYMGRDPNSKDAADYRDAYEVLRRIRPYVDQFSSTYLNDVAGGDICVAMSWSGDAGMIQRRAREAHQKFEVSYFMPKGQTGLWFTLMAIPKDAANKENALKWINRMLDVKVAAGITNAITYPTAVPAAKSLVRTELAQDPANFPSAEMIGTYFVFAPIEPALMNTITRLWLKFKAGQ
jgi:putrescine transport system substrate-binding protein